MTDDEQVFAQPCGSCDGAGSVAAGPCGPDCCTEVCRGCDGYGELFRFGSPDAPLCTAAGVPVTTTPARRGGR